MVMKSLLSILICLSGFASFAQNTPTRTRLDKAINTLCDHRAEIQNASQMFYIPSDLMYSCLLAEHVLLIDYQDNLVDVAAGAGVESIIKRNPSLGLTQIRLSTARGLSKSFYGEARTDEQLINDLLDPQRASYYMAMLVSDILSDYARYGFYLHNDPGVVCTSYHVGSSIQSARKHKKNKTQPSTNFYGEYAEDHFRLAQLIASGKVCK